MPALSYKNAYIDLSESEASWRSRISCRTELRRAARAPVRVSHLPGRPHGVIVACRAMLRSVLVAEYIRYDAGFDTLLVDPSFDLFVAYSGEVPCSFVLFDPRPLHSHFPGYMTAYLALSATDARFRPMCPNYAALDTALSSFRARGYRYANLGLLSFDSMPDTDLARVAFFKRKWGIVEVPERKECSWLRFVYYRYFRRFGAIRHLAYFMKS